MDIEIASVLGEGVRNCTLCRLMLPCWRTKPLTIGSDCRANGEPPPLPPPGLHLSLLAQDQARRRLLASLLPTSVSRTACSLFRQPFISVVVFHSVCVFFWVLGCLPLSMHRVRVRVPVFCVYFSWSQTREKRDLQRRLGLIKYLGRRR